MAAEIACITGSSLVSSIGLGRGNCFEHLLGSDSGQGVGETLSRPKGSSRAPTHTVDRDRLVAALPTDQRLAIPLEALLLQAASEMALADAGIDLGAAGTETVGVVASAHHAGLQDYGEQLWAGMCEADGMVSSTRGPWTGFNGPAGHLAIRLGTRGPNMSMLDGGIGGINALAYAVSSLSAEVTTMIVCGVEVFAPVAVEALSGNSDEDGGRPFDRSRRGCTYGNVAAAIVVESAAALGSRGARAQAEVLATSTAFSSRGSLQQASSRALRSALAQAHCPASEIGACFAGANGSVEGDAVEARAIAEVLGSQIPICAIKGAIGECGAASALAQTVLAIESLERELVPPTSGLEDLDGTLPIRATTEAEPLRHHKVIVHAWDRDCAAGAALVGSSGDRVAVSEEDRPGRSAPP